MSEERVEAVALRLTALDRTRQIAEGSLSDVREEIEMLRGKRADINDRIRNLVEQEKVLARVVRVATEEVK